MKRALVITTIAPPSAAVLRFPALLPDWRIYVVGDRKTPVPWRVDGIEFLPFSPARSTLDTVIPSDRYSRKNLGYLAAIRDGADVVVETDDDNFPYDSFGSRLDRTVFGAPVLDPGWVNVYRPFTRQGIWPRGFPLSRVAASLESTLSCGPLVGEQCPIQQCLVDGDPDVDAIYRLTIGRSASFTGVPLILRPGTYSPLNSQNTIWWKETYPLLYLPSYVSWRVCDIWRGLVAVAVAEARGWSVGVLPPTARQDRNPHDLMRDFRDELPVYLDTEAVLMQVAEAVVGTSDNAQALVAAYMALVEGGFVPARELELVQMWTELLPL